jgi:glycosyltransferase involved in cell wall biosynthesis
MPITYFVDEIQSPFVINDIKQISKKVDTIFLFSVDELEGKEALPTNVVVFESFIDWQNFKPLISVLKNFWPIIGIYINECLTLKKILPFKKSIALLASNIFKAECVMKIIKFEREKGIKTSNPSSLPPNSYSLLAYSFWFYDCIYLAWMRKKRWIGKAITRAHGGDLFEERGSLSGKLLFRNFQIKYLDKILSVSRTGTEYLQCKYTDYLSKIETCYLGSTSHNNINLINNNNRFILVSCAGVRNIKRIYKIAEMLQFIEFPLTWYHIGDENLQSKNDNTISLYLENIEKLKTNKNILYIAKGSISNNEILSFYNQTSINLFISLSETEGIPVSMMEAISFGIPILSTDVGGCKEIVTEQTGVLIPLKTEMKEVANIITEFKNSNKNTNEFRQGVRQFWEKHFNAEKNYKSLFKQIENETN